MAAPVLLTETHPTNKISPNIDLYDFPLLETTPNTQDKTDTPNSSAAVAWATLSHQQLTVDPTIYDLTRQYFDECKHTGHLAYS